MWHVLVPPPDRLDLRIAARAGAGHWRWLAPLLVLLAVAADVWLVRHGYSLSWWRAVLPVAGLLTMEKMRLARPHLPFPTWRPRDGWAPWWRVSMWVLLGSASMLIPVMMFAVRIDPSLAPAPLDGQAFLLALFPACVLAPLTEEGVYRWLFCSGFAARFTPWLVVALSGTLFAGLHVLYGNPALTNLLAGYLLAWVYLASGSLLMPILWHSAGNLLLLLLPGLFAASGS